jgi:hypothetical protein
MEDTGNRKSMSLKKAKLSLCSPNLTSAPGGHEWSASRSGRLTFCESAPGTYQTGGWVDVIANLDADYTVSYFKKTEIWKPPCRVNPSQ